MSQPPLPSDSPSLPEIRTFVWDRLQHAVRTASDPWHLPALATVGPAGPHVRTVVLRGVDAEAGVLRCHTDCRSPKFAQIAANSRTEWLFYDAGDRIQVRVSGETTVASEGADVDRYWEATALRSRGCYMAPAAPSSPLAEPGPNLPEELLDRDPTGEESEAGRSQFAIVQCRVDEIDWLRLRHDGHLRAGFRRNNDQWEEGWLAP